MRIVVDTNIAFSAILNTNSNIARILLQPKSRLHFYSTDLLLEEINEHKEKIISIAEYSNEEFEITIRLITSKIKFINLNLIPQNILVSAENLVSDVDDNDTEFVALTDHIRGKLWSGDLELQKGLKLKGWNKFISTADLIELILKKK
jgi:predicted nucleic acid-binding protein